MSNEFDKKENMPKQINLVDVYNMLIPEGTIEIRNIDTNYIKQIAVKNLVKYGFGKRLQDELQYTPEGEKLENIFSTAQEPTHAPAFTRTVPKDTNEIFANNRSLLIPTGDDYEIVIISEDRMCNLHIYPETIEISEETAEEYKDVLDDILMEEVSNLANRTAYIDRNMRI